MENIEKTLVELVLHKTLCTNFSFQKKVLIMFSMHGLKVTSSAN